jgi:site-specific recombinase XerD
MEERIHLLLALNVELPSSVNTRTKSPKQLYCHKTVKSYLYFNRDLLNSTGKESQGINDNDIKNYLFHLAEEKQSATSTINQAINALKFYYAFKPPGLDKKRYYCL